MVPYQLLQISCYVLVQSKLVQGMWAILAAAQHVSKGNWAACSGQAVAKLPHQPYPPTTCCVCPFRASLA